MSETAWTSARNSTDPRIEGLFRVLFMVVWPDSHAMRPQWRRKQSPLKAKLCLEPSTHITVAPQHIAKPAAAFTGRLT